MRVVGGGGGRCRPVSASDRSGLRSLPVPILLRRPAALALAHRSGCAGAVLVSFAPMPPICRHPFPVRACRVCGCCHYDACLGEDEEPCHWVDPDLCSVCATMARGALVA